MIQQQWQYTYILYTDNAVMFFEFNSKHVDVELQYTAKFPHGIIYPILIQRISRLH